MPLVDVPGNDGTAVPTQIDGIAVKAGTVGALTVILNVAVVAHCPAVGVNV